MTARLVTRQLACKLMVAGLGLCGCAQSTEAVSEKVEPAQVEPVEGTDLNRLVLTPKAEARLGIRTGRVSETVVPGRPGRQRAVPEEALIYQPDGRTLVYTRTERLVFLRHPVTVERLTGGVALLADGPAPGTEVVTVGASELFGIDFGIGK